MADNPEKGESKTLPKGEEDKTVAKPVNPAEIEMPRELPVLPVHGFVFFPGMGFPLNISNAASRGLIDDAVVGNRLLAVVSHKPEIDEKDRPEDHELFRVGVMGYIHKMVKGDQDIYQVLVSAVRRLRILEYRATEPYLVARVEPLASEFVNDTEVEALVLHLRDQFKKLVELTRAPAELLMTVNAIRDPFQIAYLISSQLNLDLAEEQHLLEVSDLKILLKRVARDLSKRLETVEVADEIQKSVKEDIDGKQREFFLRQQLKAIRRELGEEDDNLEIREIESRIDAARLSDEARETAVKELNRLKRISPSSPEYTVSRNYIEWILDLPWETSTRDLLDLDAAREVLDRDHYGLEKIKKRIIEFLAVRKLRADMHGPILCFAGPPGVGKTSLGQSIARALDKKFIRISLGGVRDEAEIRGHRRTYIGALPGRIIQSLKKAGSNNPLFMLDEIDKLGADFRGDPSSALLEVLDPEQNSTFADHYLEIPFDLSRVMFITTANFLDNIPGPLRDRMEVIELSSYTEEEKLMIAKDHLVPKQLEAHALSEDDLVFDDEALRKIIRSYTREAGVRNLEREIAGVCRGVARRIVSGETKKQVIRVDDLDNLIGPLKFFPESLARSWGPGLATGLAWTPVGGALLFIEAAKMSGKGVLTLTGKLGDVMKESATAALTFIRSHAPALGIDDGDFAANDLHIHVPEGAVPKDGPSAGVAMVVALTSLLTARPSRRDLAMTGEITLRGDVLPVGGVREKVLAAVRAGINEVILPFLNEKDVVEIPAMIRERLTVHYVRDIHEVLDIALEKSEKSRRKKAASG